MVQLFVYIGPFYFYVGINTKNIYLENNMSLILLEGMDKVGKTTVAQHFIDSGFEYIHMTSPRKGITRAAYIAEMLNIIASTADKKVLIDRTWMGELVWPYVFGRTPLLFWHDIDHFHGICNQMHNGDVVMIYMHDSDINAHKSRMLQYKEPSYNYDLVYNLYDSVMKKHNFQFLTFQEAEAIGWISKKD